MSGLTADLVITGGNIITVNSRDDVVEAVAVLGGRIVAVGTAGEIAACIGENTEVNDVVLGTHEKGCQVAIHAQGDYGIDVALDAIQYAMWKHPRPDPRHRIEHCQCVTPGGFRHSGRESVRGRPMGNPQHQGRTDDHRCGNRLPGRVNRPLTMRAGRW